VAVASCAFVLLGVRMFADDAEARSRVLQGMIAGIGFIGGGAIVNAGMTGATVASRDYALAVMVSAINLLTFLVLTPLEKRLH
jgi:putative Mg2+ transporter-C (MgtC) family protein